MDHMNYVEESEREREIGVRVLSDYMLKYHQKAICFTKILHGSNFEKKKKKMTIH